MVQRELSILRKRFELFRRGVAEEQRQWKNETNGLRRKIDQLERAVTLNIEKTENVSYNVTNQIQRNIEGKLSLINKKLLKIQVRQAFKRTKIQTSLKLKSD